MLDSVTLLAALHHVTWQLRFGWYELSEYLLCKYIFILHRIYEKMYYSNLKHNSIYVYITDTVMIFTMCLHLWLQGLSGCKRAKRDHQAGWFHAPQYLLRQFLRWRPCWSRYLAMGQGGTDTSRYRKYWINAVQLKSLNWVLAVIQVLLCHTLYLYLLSVIPILKTPCYFRSRSITYTMTWNVCKGIWPKLQYISVAFTLQDIVCRFLSLLITIAIELY